VVATNNQQRVQMILAEAQILRDANRNREAFDLLEKSLEKLPNHPDLLYESAMTAEKLSKLDVQESQLKKLIQLKPDYAHAYNALGYSLADRNERLPEARDLIEKALKLSPDDSFIIDSMGWVLYRQGKTKDALEWLQKAYAARPDAEIAAHLGEVLWVLGRHDAAERVLSDAAQKDPGNEAIANTLKRLKR
jgi:tetratricopeptide (TPR) repeat protein